MYKYAGSQNGVECWCGNDYGKFGASSSCTARCRAEHLQTCGGLGANSVMRAYMPRTTAHNTTRYDTRCYIKVRSKPDMSQFSGAARGRRGEASPLWVDVQKLCNMCVLTLSWNFIVSHDKYIARPSSKEPR